MSDMDFGIPFSYIISRNDSDITSGSDHMNNIFKGICRALEENHWGIPLMIATGPSIHNVTKLIKSQHGFIAHVVICIACPASAPSQKWSIWAVEGKWGQSLSHCQCRRDPRLSCIGNKWYHWSHLILQSHVLALKQWWFVFATAQTMRPHVSMTYQQRCAM